jgi:PAS domain S-box-containing protein
MGSLQKLVPDEIVELKRRLDEAEAALEAAAGDGLAGSERRFRLPAEATSASIFILNEMIVRYANPAAAQLTGYTIDELLDRPFWELADSTYRELLKRQGLRRIDGKSSARFEIKIHTKTGQERWLDLTSGSIEYEGQAATVVTAFDITERDQAKKALQNAKAALVMEILDRKQAEEAVRAERQRFNDVLETLPAYLILLTPDYHVPFANRFFRERFGESNRRYCYEFLFGRTEPCENCETFKVLKTLQPHRWEWTGPDGRNYDIYDFPFTDVDGSRLIMEMGIDITERKQAEAELRRYQEHLEDRVSERTEELRIANSQLEDEIIERKQASDELHRLNRTLKALSNSSQAMSHAVSEGDYLNEVCRIIIEDCGHAMVWIGYAEHDARKSVRPVASAGFDAGYLDSLNISWADTKRGRGPTGTAIRTGKPSRCNDMLTDPRFTPWREEALKRGYASSIVLPLLRGKEAFGALSIYAREPNSFSEDEEKLLLELAGDLAYGIAAIRLQEDRAHAEDALRRSEARYHSLFDNMTEGFALHEILCDESGKPCDYRFLEINASFERLTGLRRDRAYGKLVSEVIPDIEPFWIQAYGEVALTGKPAHLVNHSEALGRYYDVYAYSPGPRQFATIFSDVTERKQAEARLAYLASFPERNPNPVVEVDFDGQVRYANPAALNLFVDLKEQGPAHAWLADWESVVRSFRQGKTETTVRDVTVGERSYQQSLYSIGTEGLIRIYGLDITQSKRVEAELLNERASRQDHDRLEQRVQERTAELASANDQLRAEVAARQAALEQLEAEVAKRGKVQEEL